VHIDGGTSFKMTEPDSGNWVRRIKRKHAGCDAASSAEVNDRPGDVTIAELLKAAGYHIGGVPWNNNNAEHAVKAFATLRDLSHVKIRLVAKGMMVS
jgi:hypothetical protein